MELASGRRRIGPCLDPGSRVRRFLLLGVCALAGCRASALPESQVFPAGTEFAARYLRVDGANIRYIDAGHGAPVIFLHGLGASIELSHAPRRGAAAKRPLLLAPEFLDLALQFFWLGRFG